MVDSRIMIEVKHDLVDRQALAPEIEFNSRRWDITKIVKNTFKAL